LYGLLALTPMAGCDTKDLQDLNIHPQAVNTIDLNFVFTAAQLGIASGGSAGDNRYIDWRTNIGYTGYFVQQLGAAGTGGLTAGNVYSENFESNNAPFEFLYGDVLKNIQIILKQTGPGGWDEGKKVNLRNSARILRVLAFHRLTDYYGAIPYFEALEGLEGNFFPKYDKQSQIYPDLLKELDEAVAGFSATALPEGFPASDLLYKGDVAKWKKFGNSLMLRLAMRVSNVNPQLAAQYVTKAVAGGVMESNADNAIVPMSEGPSLWINQNGISRAFFPGDGGQQSFLGETFVNWLKGNPNSMADTDPRLMIISGGSGTWTATATGGTFTPVNTNPLTQQGVPAGRDANQLTQEFGVPGADFDKFFSRINVKLLDRGEPYMLMNAAEPHLLMAEAKVRNIGTVPGTAKDHYEMGVKMAMQMYTIHDPSFVVSDAQVASYLAARPYGVTKPALEMIGEQLWASKFLNWWEAWADWRRTGFPQLTPVVHPAGITNGVIPRRLRYPAYEQAANPNFSTGATAPDLLVTKVWWDGGQE
jgi:hypothetical protein